MLSYESDSACAQYRFKKAVATELSSQTHVHALIKLRQSVVEVSVALG